MCSNQNYEVTTDIDYLKLVLVGISVGVYHSFDSVTEHQVQVVVIGDKPASKRSSVPKFDSDGLSQQGVHQLHRMLLLFANLHRFCHFY